jgi:hypothetical protein
MRYVVVLLAALLVPVAGAAASPSPPGTLTAQAQCKAQGYAVGTQDFAACIARQLSGSPKKTTPTTSPTTQPSATLAKAVCRGLGLTRGTQAFTRCLNLQAKRLRHTKGVAPGTP